MTKRKLGCTRITLEGEHPKNCKCTTAFCEHKHQINGWIGKALMGPPVMICMDCGALDKLQGKGFEGGKNERSNSRLN